MEVQILDTAVCVSLLDNAIEKSMKPSDLAQAKSWLFELDRPVVWQTGLKGKCWIQITSTNVSAWQGNLIYCVSQESFLSTGTV